MTQTLTEPRPAAFSRPPRVALYARISDDKYGDHVGTDRQLRTARERAERDGYEVVAEFVDNSISALHAGKRPEYARLLDLVAAGGVEHVIAWQQSRLFRNRLERAAAIELFSERAVGILFVEAQDLDLSTAYGRAMAGLLGEFDTMESEVKSERITASAGDLARRGLPNGKLGYGWAVVKDASGKRIGYREDAEQAPIVREIVKRLLSGDSLNGITTDLNARGVVGPTGGAWDHTAVRKTAKRESNAAIRIYHRGKPDEQRYDGVWPALVERAAWERVSALLDDSTKRAREGRGSHAPRPGRRAYLLTSGVGACGVCGSKLRVAKKGTLYACAARGCVGRSRERIDELVRLAVLGKMTSDDKALDWLLGDEAEAKAASDRAAELRRRLDDASDKYADGVLTMAQFERITIRLRPQVEAAERERSRLMRGRDLSVLIDLAGPDAAAVWERMNIAQRHQAASLLIDRVVVNPSTTPGRFNPADVVFEWHGTDGN